MSLESLVKELGGLEHEFTGGVDERTVSEASTAIGLPFPPGYVEFLRRFGCGFMSFHELIGLGGPAHLDVVKQTLYLREKARVSRFPQHFIPILTDGFANYECLDASNKDARSEFPVVQWLHDGGDDQIPRVLAQSYEEWLRALVVQIRAVEAADRQAT